MSEHQIDMAHEYREQIGVAAMMATTCTHDGDEFGPRAVCETCWGNVQSICDAVLRVVDRAVIAAAPTLNSELLYDGRENPIAAAYVEGFKDAHEAVHALHTPRPHPTCPACHHSTDAHGITDVCAVDDCECAGGGL